MRAGCPPRYLVERLVLRNLEVGKYSFAFTTSPTATVACTSSVAPSGQACERALHRDRERVAQGTMSQHGIENVWTEPLHSLEALPVEGGMGGTTREALAEVGLAVSKYTAA